MSQQLIDRNADLKKLRDDGYDIEVRSNFLLIKNVPYVNSNKEVKLGTLVSGLHLAGEMTTTPDTHVACFIGDYPCYHDGSEIRQIKHQSGDQTLDKDLVVNHSFSAKPNGGYKDYYTKMMTYADIISGPAETIDPRVTAKIFPVIATCEQESVFNYVDTASSRAGITAITRKLELEKIAIVGLGGTGSYILDLVAKTPVREIHLFDGDEFLNHNAFRSPGAASIDELSKRSKKVVYFSELYSRMRRNIFPHDNYLDSQNINQLQGMNFVFLCLDRGMDKLPIVERLEEWGTSFIDVGMGVQLIDEFLIGVLRVTTSTVNKRDHVRTKNRIPFSDVNGDDEYSQNIQIADLNSFNAALAVIKWKKLFGFYKDYDNEHFSTYTIDGNVLDNEDKL
jgi:hypothetical protein